MKISRDSGMTLTELIISTALVGLIMLGVTSIDFATQRSQKTTSRASTVAMQTGATMLELSKNISLSAGTQDNPGVDTTTTNLCVRQDRNQTPGNFTDDTWVCYTLIGNAIYTCSGPAAAACSAADRFIGTATALTINLVSDNRSTVQDFYVDIDITTRYDPASAFDALNNPQFRLHSRVTPVNHTLSQF